MYYTKSAAFYDAIYHWKDYATEAQKLDAVIQRAKQTSGNTLLEVACGTAEHARHLHEPYAITGLDLDEEMLAVAREKLPDITFHRGDMRDFDLGKQFDIVTCLFGSIGYMLTMDELIQALTMMRRHTKQGGTLIVEPFVLRERWKGGRISAIHVDLPGMILTRITKTEDQGTIATLDFHYLVGIEGEIKYFIEHHELALYTLEQYLLAFRSAGLDASFDPEGLMGRGLFTAVVPHLYNAC